VISQNGVPGDALLSVIGFSGQGKKFRLAELVLLPVLRAIQCETAADLQAYAVTFTPNLPAVGLSDLR
jgi:hypothetical protein